ncbi:MAG: hypothetical protein RLZZ272_69, partial [Actinomycetota bacterium]
MSRTPRPRGTFRRPWRRSRSSPAVRAPSERWLRDLLAGSDAARRFFDPGWYLVRHPDLLAAGVDPVRHYASHGAREGRDPSPLVAATWYASSVDEVATGRTSVLEHLVRTGEREALAPSPFVDLEWYERRYPDATASGGTGFEHLWRCGLEERRAPSPFVDLEWYAVEHPEVGDSGLDALTHFVTVGHGLGWWAHPLWDEQEYLRLNPTVRTALALGRARSGYEHFCGRGAGHVVRGFAVVSHQVGDRRTDHVEGRYLRERPDVAEAVATGRFRHGLEHLFAQGHRELAVGSRSLRIEPGPRASEVHRGAGGDPSADIAVLLAHHDRDGQVDAHVDRAIAALRTAGAAVHLVTSGLAPDALERVLPSVATVIVKAENGSTLDFGSWSLALDVLAGE